MTFLEGLNTEQRLAAETLTGPLLIVAGAGSGKTRALTFRIANMISQGVAKPWQILAVTFTNKAAQEMKTRVERLLEKHFPGHDPKNVPTIGTFHSICARILRTHPEMIGREKSFVIYDDHDSESLVKRIMKERMVDEERIKPRAVMGAISNSKNRVRSAENLMKMATRPFDKTVAEIYAEYEKRLKQNNALDFDDLLLCAVRLFQEQPQVLDYYQEKWRFISVDEYQDTNHVQYILTKLLASKYRNLCVIGDSDQSIYGFRGADISNILDFEKDYPDAKLIKLEQNYRSTQSILDAADSIIEKNKQRKSKKMWTEQKGGDPIQIWHLGSEYEEAERITQEIERLRREEGAKLNDIVTLYRTNAQSRVLEEALLKSGLPYKVIGGVRFYARKEVKDILAYLRIVLNPQDSDALLRIVNVPSRKIGATTLQKLQAFAMGRSLTLGEMMKHIDMVTELPDSARSRLSQFWNLVERWKERSQKIVVSELLKEIIRDIGYKEFLTDGTEEGEMRYDNILELVSVSGKYDGLEPHESLSSFLEEVALVAETDKINREEDALTLMTLHSVKGLEYPYVFIAGCEENLFPHSRTMFNPEEMEEERRLMYVGVTRAMKRLYLVAAKQRQIFGEYQHNPISRFIHDIPEHLSERVGVEKSRVELFRVSEHDQRPKEEIMVRLTAEQKFKDGDHVRHASFGEGIVVERRGDLVTIAFLDKLWGIKKFAANIAPLEKIG
ncbi:UvrD-helicase domain-containing protein [Candidatus Peregrinibacteria bacterium]|nr:UvrD-helicase domain-containing protein [Candidatus Peregrinibacteria bacterium]